MGGVQTYRGIKHTRGIQTYRQPSKHTVGASKHMEASKHTRGIQTDRGIQMYGVHMDTPLSLTKNALFVLPMYSRHPNIFQR